MSPEIAYLLDIWSIVPVKENRLEIPSKETYLDSKLTNALHVAVVKNKTLVLLGKLEKSPR
jgi:hypothetical protein